MSSPPPLLEDAKSWYTIAYSEDKAAVGGGGSGAPHRAAGEGGSAEAGAAAGAAAGPLHQQELRALRSTSSEERSKRCHARRGSILSRQ